MYVIKTKIMCIAEISENDENDIWAALSAHGVKVALGHSKSIYPWFDAVHTTGVPSALHTTNGAPELYAPAVEELPT